MHRSNKLTHLILSHLSKNNNSPEIVEILFMQHSGETKIIVASRYNETAVCIIYSKRHHQLKKIFIQSAGCSVKYV